MIRELERQSEQFATIAVLLSIISFLTTFSTLSLVCLFPDLDKANEQCDGNEIELEVFDRNLLESASYIPSEPFLTGLNHTLMFEKYNNASLALDNVSLDRPMIVGKLGNRKIKIKKFLSERNFKPY